MRKIVFVGKLIKKSQTVKTSFYTNNNNTKANFISECVVFRSSGCGENFEIHELLAENGLVFRKYIPI